MIFQLYKLIYFCSFIRVFLKRNLYNVITLMETVVLNPFPDVSKNSTWAGFSPFPVRKGFYYE